MTCILQVLGRPKEGSTSMDITSYISNVLKALYSAEISKQLNMDRY